MTAMPPSPSSAQLASAIRTLIATLGGFVGGWAIAKGYVTQSQVNAILSNEQFLGAATTVLMTAGGLVVSTIVGAYAVVAHKPANIVAEVAALPEVARVVTAPTPAGDALAASVPSPIVAPAQ